MSEKLHQVLIRPLLTEKVTSLRESGNTVAFVVSSRANRVEVRRALESLLKVKVERVNILNEMGKTKRLGRFVGKKQDWKKALVTLKAGEKLELYESV